MSLAASIPTAAAARALRVLSRGVLAVALCWLHIGGAHADELEVSPSSLSLSVGSIAASRVSEASGAVSVRSDNVAIASASYANRVVSIKGLQPGKTRIRVSDARSSQKIEVTVKGSSDGLSLSPTSLALAVNATGQIQVAGASGSIAVRSANPLVASASYANSIVTVRALTAGSTSVTVSDSRTSRSVAVVVSATASGGTVGRYALIAWNDLGMHCVDGSDYSVFSILPPYNNLHAQLVDTGSASLVTSSVSLSYEAVADANGSINTISSTKTNFWQYVKSLFGVEPAPDIGLAGKPTPSATPAPMTYNATQGWFEAEGIPITPVDDYRNKNFYPMVKVVARDSAGRELASTRTVLPVSDEMTCKGCHSSIANGNAAQIAARPKAGWVFDSSAERDWKRNILRLHDEKQLASASYTQALATLKYDARGLAITADSGRPILCAACHGSNALPGTGVSGVSTMTAAMHTRHAQAIDPLRGIALDADSNRTACYQCHPGSETKCLRGAMSNVVDAAGAEAISCQSCHGNMAAVGKPTRVGWLQEPNCQSCHHDGKRETSALDAGGVLRIVSDTRFATNPNKPASGFSLFRFSKGHGNLQCEACHGATHAEYPSVEANDNVQSIKLQGYAGTLTECRACHASVPNTTSGGPHGMHTIGDAWVSRHGGVAEGSGRNGCAYCHGADFRGSPLSAIKVAKSFRVEGATKAFAAGHQVTCYDCHNGPNGD